MLVLSLIGGAGRQLSVLPCNRRLLGRSPEVGYIAV